MLINYDINQMSKAAESNSNNIIEEFKKKGKEISHNDALLWGYLRKYYEIARDSQLFADSLGDNVEKLKEEAKEDKNSRVKLKTVYAYKDLMPTLHAFSSESLSFKSQSELEKISFEALQESISNIPLNRAKYLITMKEFDAEHLDDYESQVHEINAEMHSRKMHDEEPLSDEIKSKISKLYGTTDEKVISHISEIMGTCGYSYENNAGSKCGADVELIYFINSAINSIELSNKNEHDNEHTIK